MSRNIPEPQSRAALAWIEGVLTAMGSTRGPGRNGKWQCPAHARSGEHAPSLQVGIRDQGGVWFKCHAECSTKEVCHALGTTLDQLRRPAPRVSPRRSIVCRGLEVGFPAPKTTGSPRSEGYRHERFHYYGRRVRLERLRHPVTGDKAMEWQRLNDKDEWVWGLPDDVREVDLPLYREHELAAATALGEIVLVVESESSADALTGWYATTWAGGAAAPPLERLAELLADHQQVVIIGDADDPGRRCAARIAQVLPHASVLVSEREGEDARDLLTRLGPEGFTALVTGALAAAAPTEHAPAPAA